MPLNNKENINTGTSNVNNDPPVTKKLKVPNNKKLTLKQQLFITEYIKNMGNGTQAAANVYKTKNLNTAHAIASENLRKPTVVQEMEKALQDLLGFDDELLNEKTLAAETFKIFQNCGENEKMVKIKALELLAKIKKISSESIQIKPAADTQEKQKDVKDLSTDELTQELLKRLTLNKVRVM